MTKTIVTYFERSHMTTEEELSFQSGISTMRALHVVVDSAQWNVQIQVKRQDDASEQSYERRKSCILKIRELNFHTSELCSPSNVGIIWATSWRGGLPANGLPDQEK
jgi:hypothetical protein